MKNLLFNPGPTNVSEAVRNAIRTRDICHREPEFSDVLLRVNKNIVKVLNGEDTHSAVLFVSSGTGCNEAIINSISGKVLVVQNGKYSERILEIMDAYGLPRAVLEFEPTKPIDIQKIEDMLNRDPAITHIYAVHHETTTGALTPIRTLGKLAKMHKKVFCVDAVSSLGGHAFDLKEDNIDFCAVSANKCLESFPGVSFVIARTNELEKTKGLARSFYFDLYRQWEKEKKGQTPFTPAVQLIMALDQALQELVEEGYDNRVRRYERLAERMREGLNKLGFHLLLLPEDMQSNILTAIEMPEDMDYWNVHDKLKLRGITIYSDDKVLSKRKFRVATLGNITEQDIDYFLKNLKEVLEECRKGE